MLKLKKIITCVLITACLVCSVGVASACNEGKDYSEDITKLQQQLETLLNQNGNYSSEIEKLQQQIDNLKTENGDFSSEIDKLEQQIAAQQKLIESLQNVVNVEPKVYKIGETFTYSYQGMDFFSITVLNRSQIKIKNINMSAAASVNTYLRVLCYNFDRESVRVTNFSSKLIEPNQEFIEPMSFPEGYDILHLGFPTGADGIAPYAIFNLTA